MSSRGRLSIGAILFVVSFPASTAIGADPGLGTLGPTLIDEAVRLGPASQAADADGEWDVPPPTGRAGHTAIYDPVRDRMIEFGGYTVGSVLLNEVWTLSLADSAIWTQLFPTGETAPSARFNHTAIYDPVRDRMVVFGGSNNQTFALSLAGTPEWSNLAPAGTPPTNLASGACTAVYDPIRDRMLVFGGNGPNADLWELTLNGGPVWTKLAPEGTLPAGRLDHTAVYDPVRDRMLVFGGYGGGARNDTWSLSLAGGTPTWVPLTTSGTLPSARYAHSAVYDPVNDRMIIYGGLGASSERLADVWALSLAGAPAWTQLTFSGSQPNARNSHTAIYDPHHQRMVVWAGSGGPVGGGPYLSDVGSVSLSGDPTWTQVTPIWTPPVARSFASAVYDSSRARMIVFGGAMSGIARNDVWTLSLVGMPAWSELVTSGTPPNPREYQSMIYDSARDRLVVFGGWDGTNHIYRNDVWALSLSGSPTWTQLLPEGAPPHSRGFHQAIYDPAMDRMVVFGGYDNTNYYNDAWELTLAGTPRWTQLAPGAAPSARTGATAIYDPDRRRMVVFGGYTGSGVALNDTWVLSLSGSPVWTQLSPGGTLPVGRVWHSAVYDQVRDRMVVFAGSAGCCQANDTWALSLSDGGTWSLLAVGGTPPIERWGQSAIFDANGNRMVTFGGGDNNLQYNDVRFLTFGGAMTSVFLTDFRAAPTIEGMELLWTTTDESDHVGFHVWRRVATQVTSEEVRLTTDLITSADEHYRFLDVAAEAGQTYEYRLADVSRTGTVTFHGPYTATMPEDARPSRVWLGLAAPNPTRSHASVRFALPEAGTAMLQVFDVQGRMVRTLVDGVIPAGLHEAAWDGLSSAGRPAAAGVFYFRLDAGGVVKTSKLMLLR